MLPEKFKNKIIAGVEELWCVWRSLGVYSEGDIIPMSPEEAIIGLCVFGRYNQRLFDEALSFIIQYARFISKNRLLYLVKKLDANSKIVFYIIAAYLEKMNSDRRFSSIYPDSWQENKASASPFFIPLQNTGFFIGKEEDLLFSRWGFSRNIFTQSKKLKNLNFISDQNQWIRAKMIFGNTVRADTVMELMGNKKCTAPSIAFNTGYTQKSVWNVLNDFELAGLVEGKRYLNSIQYSISPKGYKLFAEFEIKVKPSILSAWLRTGHYVAAYMLLPENASELLILTEEKRVEKLCNELQLEKR